MCAWVQCAVQTMHGSLKMEQFDNNYFMVSIVRTTNLRIGKYVTLNMRFRTTVDEDRTRLCVCVWSAASRVMIGQARNCGEGVTCLRDVGYLLVLEHFRGVRGAGKAILEWHALLDGSTHSFRNDLRFGLHIRQLRLPWPGEHVGREYSITSALLSPFSVVRGAHN